jgi:hypothetical protein
VSNAGNWQATAANRRNGELATGRLVGQGSRIAVANISGATVLKPDVIVLDRFACRAVFIAWLHQRHMGRRLVRLLILESR